MPLLTPRTLAWPIIFLFQMPVMSWFAIGACNHASVPCADFAQVSTLLLWGRVSDEGIGAGGKHSGN